MRRIVTTLMAACLLFFVACSDEGDDVTIYNGDTFTSDYKASQMFSTLSLYENIARQPEMGGKLLVNFLISVGLIESMPIIAAVISIVLVFANPFK